MPNKPTVVNKRRKLLKATATAAFAGLPLSVLGNNTTNALPSIISFLLDDVDENSIVSTAVLEGEGTGSLTNFPTNTVTLNRAENTVEAFFARFRPDFFASRNERDDGFDDLTAQLPQPLEQEVTLTITAIAPSSPIISVDLPSQTVMSDSSGLATFSKVSFAERFGPFSNLPNHTFELRFSSVGFEDAVITVTLDFESPYLELGSIAIEATPAPGQRQNRITFSGTNRNTLNDFYRRLRPDLQNANGGPEVAIESLDVTLTPAPTSPVEVTVNVEVIEGEQLSLDPITSSQSILSTSYIVSFEKIAISPSDFGPVGSPNPVTNNHTIRFTWSAEGYAPASYDIFLDLESP